MKPRLSDFHTFIVALICLIFAVQIAVAKDEWQRVITGADSTIDVNATSLILQPNRALSAKFRTTLSKSESVAAKAGPSYRVRLETIQFRSREWQYRIVETTLLDSSGKIVLSYPYDEEIGWKEIKGPTARQFFSSASSLPPFGAWKVISFRYAEGAGTSTDEPPDVKELIGSNFYLLFDRVQVGKATCSTPDFESRVISNEDFTKITGYPLKSLAVQTDKIDALVLKCASEKLFPSQSLILRLANGRMLMLWEGVFVELEKKK
jgi:hypothetical protein